MSSLNAVGRIWIAYGPKPRDLKPFVRGDGREVLKPNSNFPVKVTRLMPCDHPAAIAPAMHDNLRKPAESEESEVPVGLIFHHAADEISPGIAARILNLRLAMPESAKGDPKVSENCLLEAVEPLLFRNTKYNPQDR